jgi:hypothetical protein
VAKTSLRVDFKGPFFTRDPVKTYQANVRDLMDKLAAEGERDVKLQMQAGQASRYPLGGGIRPGRVSAHVVGRTVSLKGKQWAQTAVVSVRNQGFTKKQAIKLMAAASWLESSIHPFRRTAARIRRSRALLTADLLKGLD